MSTACIFLDHQSTTPTDPRVVQAMLPYFSEAFGNPHSRSHGFGEAAGGAVEAARAQIAALIGASPREIVFTSGATEANNLALKGAAHFPGAGKRHLVTCVTEHKCVLESCRELADEGFAVTYLPVDGAGHVDLDRLRASLRDDTLLVSIMAVNNEIGVIAPLAEIGALCRERGILFHTDAAQAAGKIALDVEAMRVDLLSLSAHKLYGPKGIGALYVRRRPRVRLKPLFSGGGQERGLRSGTLPTPLCVGFGAACALAARDMAGEEQRLRWLRERFWDLLTERVAGVRVNGDNERRVAGNLNIAIDGIDADHLLHRLPTVALSSGSACASSSIEPSYVLRALGLSEAAARGSVRVGFGRQTSEDEVERAARALAEAIVALRREATDGMAA